jgi:hypothetical protein
MIKRMIFMLFAVLIYLGHGANAWSQDVCEPKATLLQTPTPEPVKKCIHSIWFFLGRHQQIDSDFSQKLTTTLLPATSQDSDKLSKLGQFDIDYVQIAEIISLMSSDSLTKRYVDFIIETQGSADELRSFGLGKLYTLRAPYFLAILSKYKPKEQQVVISSLAWGLANNFYPHLTTKNYRRLIIGEYWELLNEKQTNRRLAATIEKEVLKIIEETSKAK